MARNGDLLSGQQYDPSTDIVKPFTEQMMNRAEAEAILGQARTEIIPHDAQNSLVRVHAGTAAAYNAAVHRLAGTVVMNKAQLPDTLVSVAVTYNSSEQAGEDINNPPLFEVGGFSGEASISANAQAQAGAGVIPDIQPIIKEAPAGYPLPCEHDFFYIEGDVTLAAVLAKLTTIHGSTVSEWPIFRPVGQTFTLKGQNVSVRANATSRQAMSYGPDGSFSWQVLPGNDPTGAQSGDTVTGNRADGYSKEVGLTSRQVTLPPTINALITLSSTSLTKTATVTVKANMDPIAGTQAVIAIVNEPAARTITASGEISPTTVPATNVTAIPSSGRYLIDLNVQFADFGFSYVHAVVINAAMFA